MLLQFQMPTCKFFFFVLLSLAGRSELESGDKVWYFFCSPRYKYRNSKRKNRVTKKGYWKPTGKPCEIVTTYDGREITGNRQALVFYQGRVIDKMKNENKTPWVIHEFKLTLNLPNQVCSICQLPCMDQITVFFLLYLYFRSLFNSKSALIFVSELYWRSSLLELFS